MINYNRPSQGITNGVVLHEQVPHDVISINASDNEFISYKNMGIFKSLTSLNLSYSSIRGSQVMNVLKGAKALLRLNISFPLGNHQKLDYNKLIINEMASLTALSCIAFGQFDYVDLNYALHTLKDLRELRISLSNSIDGKVDELESHPNLREIHIYGEDEEQSHQLKLPPSLRVLKLNNYVLDAESSALLLRSDKLLELNLSGSYLHKSALPLLAYNTSLTKLAIVGDDDVCQYVAGSKTLKHISLKKKHISRNVLRSTILDPSKPLLTNLVSLQLAHVRFDEKCAIRCAHATNLTTIKLKDCEFSSGAARVLYRSVPTLKILTLRKCATINDEVACWLLQHPTLENLNLGLTEISDNSVPFMVLNCKLTRLTMYAHLSAQSVSRIIEQNSTLTALSINGSPVEEQHLQALEKNTKLIEIHLAMGNDFWSRILSTRPKLVCAGAMSE
jgi:hypothetical protein